MASATSIPRFLLPQRGAIWQQSPRRLLQRATKHKSAPGQLRHASDAAGKGKGKQQIVLEKPARFNPPSHGQRLPKKGAIPRHYGGDLSQTEKAAQAVRDYPNMMAPKGTTQHWILHSHKLHVFLTLGTLSGLALFVFIVNFKATSPYADMVPEWGDFFSSPVQSLRTLGAVVRMHEEHRSAEVAEKRKRRVEDVAKRDEYRKAHGLDTQTAWGAWSTKMSEKLEGTNGEAGDDGASPKAARKEEVIDEEAVIEAAKKKSWFRLWM